MSRNQMLAIATLIFLSAGSSVVQAQSSDEAREVAVPHLLADDVTLDQYNLPSEPHFTRAIGQSSWRLEFPLPTGSFGAFTESADLDDWQRGHYPERLYRPSGIVGISLHFDF